MWLTRWTPKQHTHKYRQHRNMDCVAIRISCSLFGELIMAGSSGQRTNVCLLAELSSVLKVCRVSAFTPTLRPCRWEITAACCSPSKTLLTTAASRTRSGHWLAAVNTFCNLCWLHYYFQSPLKTLFIEETKRVIVGCMLR